MSIIWVVLVLLGFVGWLIYLFNTLVSLSNRADVAWAEIDSQFKRRYDLAAQLLELVATAAPTDKAALDQLAASRATALDAFTPSEKSRTEPAFVAAVLRVLSLAEANPQLKSRDDFPQLQHTLIDIEDYLTTARRSYNAIVRELNGCIGSPVNSVAATLFGVVPRELYQEDADRPPVAANQIPAQG